MHMYFVHSKCCTCTELPMARAGRLQLDTWIDCKHCYVNRTADLHLKNSIK